MKSDLRQLGVVFARQRQRARSDSSVVIHSYPLSEPHDISGAEVCWCEPQVEDFRDRGGGVLLIHNTQVWH